MTALSAAAQRTQQLGNALEEEYGVTGSVTIYKGSICMVTSSGYATPCASATANNARFCIGVATGAADNSAGAAGAINVRVRYGHREHFAKAAALTAGLLGDEVCATDDNTAGVAVTSAPVMGTLVRITSGGLAVVHVRQFLDGL